MRWKRAMLCRQKRESTLSACNTLPKHWSQGNCHNLLTFLPITRNFVRVYSQHTTQLVECGRRRSGQAPTRLFSCIKMGAGSAKLKCWGKFVHACVWSQGWRPWILAHTALDQEEPQTFSKRACQKIKKCNKDTGYLLPSRDTSKFNSCRDIVASIIGVVGEPKQLPDAIARKFAWKNTQRRKQTSSSRVPRKSRNQEGETRKMKRSALYTAMQYQQPAKQNSVGGDRCCWCAILIWGQTRGNVCQSQIYIRNLSGDYPGSNSG